MNISGLIKSIAWNKSSTGAYTLGNATYKIYLKSTTSTSVPTTYAAYSTELTGATLVYSSTTQNIPSTTGWETYNFNVGNFNYDGITNLMVFVEFYRPGNATAAINY
jgi:trimeric autotransporter adhesin